jgi:hypothetical protein
MYPTSLKGKKIHLLHPSHPDDLTSILLQNRGFSEQAIMTDIGHDPFLLPDMQRIVDRILLACERGERVMIF